MNQKQQKQIIRTMCRELQKHMLDHVKNIPSSWDGHELRQWLADCANEQFNYRSLDRARLREYKNTRMTFNV